VIGESPEAIEQRRWSSAGSQTVSGARLLAGFVSHRRHLLVGSARIDDEFERVGVLVLLVQMQLGIDTRRISQSDFGPGIRVSTATQLTSHVFPPSSEKACSKVQELAEMSFQTLRTRSMRPLTSSQS